MEDKTINIINRALSLHVYALDNEKNESDELSEIMKKEYESACETMKEHILRSMNSMLKNFTEA